MPPSAIRRACLAAALAATAGRLYAAAPAVPGEATASPHSAAAETAADGDGTPRSVPGELPRVDAPGGGSLDPGTSLPSLGENFGPDHRAGPLARPLFELLVGMKGRLSAGIGGPEADMICRIVMEDGTLDDIEADLIAELTDLRVSYGRPWRRELKITAAPEAAWAPAPDNLMIMVIRAGWEKLLDCTGIEPPPQPPPAGQQSEEELAASIESAAGPEDLMPLARQGGPSAARLAAAFQRVLVKAWETDKRAAPAAALRMQLGRIYARGASLQGAAKQEWRALIRDAAKALDESEKGAVPDEAWSWLDVKP